MLTEFYNKISSYLVETFGTNFIFLTIVFTTALSIGYFILMGYIITHMDKRYFIRKVIVVENIVDNAANVPLRLTPIKSSITLLVHIAKILIGLCLLLSGIVMLVLPGQGLITMLLGLSLLPFPGKNKANKDPFIFN